jgi:hypothetical protein
MTRPNAALAIAALAALASGPGLAHGQTAKPAGSAPAESAAPPAARIRVVVNGAFWPTSATFGDTRSFTEYAEKTSIRTSYETRGSFGPDVAVQTALFRGLGILVGYSRTSRDETGSVEVSRPHPLYLNRPRSASAETSGYGYSEGAIHIDLAYGRGKGRLDWSLFAGLSVFQVEADLLDRPTYNEAYPYDELLIQSVPSKTVKSNPTGFNVGGRLDYRLGRSGRFGLGVQLLYSTASVELQANPDAQTATFDAGGLQAGAGVRLYF